MACLSATRLDQRRCGLFASGWETSLSLASRHEGRTYGRLTNTDQ
jgi:hypothetical protein